MASKVKREAVVDKENLKKHLWREFINTPGVLDKLRGHLEYVKSLRENNNSENESCREQDFHPVSESSRISEVSSGLGSPVVPGIELSEAGDLMEELSEKTEGEGKTSARVSVIKLNSGAPEESPRLPNLSPRMGTESPSPRLPPLSPRTVVADVKTDPEETVFYLDNNIDGVPGRNSPVASTRRVPVIRTTQPSPPPPLATPTPASAMSPCVSPYLAATRIINCTASSPGPDISAMMSPVSSLAPDHTAASAIPALHHSRAPIPVLDSGLVNSIQTRFSEVPGNQMTEASCNLADILGVHPYLNSTIYRACYEAAVSGNCSTFISFLQANASTLYTNSEGGKMFHLMAMAGSRRGYLVPDDFKPMLMSFINSHPQLEFFTEVTYHNLHEAFVTAITASLFYSVGAWRSQKMYFRQFLSLHLPDVLHYLEHVEDNDTFNSIEHFSYDQFYVFYVKFVQLDENSDLVLSREEFTEYEEGRFTRKLAERLFQLNVGGDKMDFWSWIIFLLADIDKTTATSMEYWYPVLNLANDGFLSLNDLSQFYKDNIVHLIASDCLVHQVVAWVDLRTQLLDLLTPGPWTLMNVKKKSSDKLAHLLNAFLNIFEFYSNDENDVSIKSDLTLVKEFVMRAMQE